MKNYYINYFNKVNESLTHSFKYFQNNINGLEKYLLKVKSSKNKVIIFGNGGSSAISSHFSNDLNNSGIKCLSFNNPQLITCYANDYGYKNYAKKCIDLFAEKKDLVILISSSGMSENMLIAARLLNKKKINFFSLTGFNYKNKLNNLSKNHIWINSKNYNIVENSHQLILLTIIDKINNKIIK